MHCYIWLISSQGHGLLKVETISLSSCPKGQRHCFVISTLWPLLYKTITQEEKGRTTSLIHIWSIVVQDKRFSPAHLELQVNVVTPCDHLSFTFINITGQWTGMDPLQLTNSFKCMWQNWFAPSPAHWYRYRFTGHFWDHHIGAFVPAQPGHPGASLQEQRSSQENHDSHRAPSPLLQHLCHPPSQPTVGTTHLYFYVCVCVCECVSH